MYTVQVRTTSFILYILVFIIRVATGRKLFAWLPIVEKIKSKSARTQVIVAQVWNCIRNAYAEDCLFSDAT